MNKAYTQLRVKSFDEDAGIIRGIATTPTTDRDGDIVEPMGATFTLPLPLHSEHDRKDVVGEVFEATATPEGIEYAARIAKDVSEQIAEVWRRVKAGLIKHVSIGFRAIEYAHTDTGLHFQKWEWLELSLTTVPANAGASITAVKSAPTTSVHQQEGKPKMTIAEQIQKFQAKRAELQGRMDTLVTKGVTLEGDDATAYDAAEAELAQVEKHLERLKAAEQRQGSTAQPVAGIKAASVTVQDNEPKGVAFARYTKALALGRGNPMQALEIAKSMKMGARVETVLKAAVSAGSTTSADFTALVEPANLASEFIDLLRPAMILTRMTGTRRVPMNVKLPKKASGTASGWIGEGKPAPVTNAQFDDMTVGEHKIGAIAVFTEELLRRADPEVDVIVRDDLIEEIARNVDLTFIDQANAGVAGVKPASIANGATSAAASGTTADDVRDDVKAAYIAAANANQPLSSAVWIMHPSTALALSMMRHATSGQREFPGVDFTTGGTFEGLPVIVSTNVPGDGVAGYDMVLAVQSEILMAEGGLAIDASREASLEMSDAPVHDSKTPTPAQLVSLWQTGAVAIKAIRGITWERRRPTAVYRISAAKYA